MVKHPRIRLSTLWLLAASATVTAHHSGLYDDNDVVEVAGTITSVAWINPHVTIKLESTSAGGQIERWQVEGTSVNALQRWGIARDMFRVGDRIAVTGPRSLFGRNTMIAATAVLADGEQVVLWPNVAARLGLADTGVQGLFPPPGDVDTGQAQGIFRIWTPRGRPRTSLDELPLTASAREAQAAYRALDDDPALSCIPPGMPVMLGTPYPVEFVDDGDEIIMRFEEWDGLRTIYMQAGTDRPIVDHSPKGVSVGRWEGETLAIFTTNIDYPYSNDLGTPQSTAVTVLERYTPNDDDSRLDWEVTVTDAATFSEPVVTRGYMAWEPGEEIKAFNCTLLDVAE